MNEHSKMFNRIKDWYETGVWSRKRVHDAVTKGKITEAEAREILGEE
jgi:plasmid stability protein